MWKHECDQLATLVLGYNLGTTGTLTGRTGDGTAEVIFFNVE
jgi:hypothetical protein